MESTIESGSKARTSDGPLDGMDPEDIIAELLCAAVTWAEEDVVAGIKALRVLLETRRERADSAIAEAFGATGRKGGKA